MPVMLGIRSKLIPLTAEAFGPDGDQVLLGWIEEYEADRGTAQGVFFRTKGRGPQYVHPKLLGRFDETNLHIPAQMTLVDGLIVIQGVDHEDNSVLLPHNEVFAPGQHPEKMPPVGELETVTLETILCLSTLVASQRERCAHANHYDPNAMHRLSLRRAVLVMLPSGDQPVAICLRCHDTHFQKTKDSRQILFLDGRRIPHQGVFSLQEE